MTIEEAIKSGKRFRRHVDCRGDEMTWQDALDRNSEHGKWADFYYDDILADDWYVEDLTHPLTLHGLHNRIVKLEATVNEMKLQKTQSFAK